MTLVERLRDLERRLTNNAAVDYDDHSDVGEAADRIEELVERCEDRDSSGRYMGCRICGTVYQGPQKHDDDCPVKKATEAYFGKPTE